MVRMKHINARQALVDLERLAEFIGENEYLLARNALGGATEYAVQLYREGKVTLREAATMADTTVREMIEILLEHGVKGNVTLDQQRKAIEFVMSKTQEFS